MTSHRITSQLRAFYIYRRVEEFFLTPASPRPLAVLRIGLAAVLIAEAWMVRNDIFNLFAHDGLVQGALAEYATRHPDAPRLSWLSSHLAKYGVSEAAIIFWVTRVYFIGLATLLFGLWTRLSSITSFLLHWTFVNSGFSGAYGVDMYAHIFLFYLTWAPSSGAYSLDLALGRVSGKPSSLARFSLRIMQIHIAISYLASAIEKSLNKEWWNGALIWGALTMPEYQQFDLNWLANWPSIPIALGWSALVTEGLFLFLIWSKRTRPFWLVLTIGMHLGIAVFLGLHIFGAIMCIIVFSLFGISGALTQWTEAK